MNSRTNLPYILSALMLAIAAPARAQEPLPPRPAAENAVDVRKLFEGATTNSGDPIVMPPGHLQVTVSKYVIPVGASLPVHKHPSPRYGYLIRGQLEVTNTQSGHVVHFTAGQFVVEDVQRWHKARNIGDGPVELLVIDFVKPGQANTVLKDKP